MGLDTSGEDKEIAELSGKYHCGEMEEYTDTYMTMVLEKFSESRKKTKDALLLIETRLDFSDYVPESFGTSDATIIADGLMEVIDFKYGKGVRVSAVENEQMKIYALGAYLLHNFEYRIERVRMTIIQPRIDNFSEYEMDIEDLLKWAEEDLRPKAIEAFKGEGAQKPGEWCKFCKVKCSCKALAGKCTDLARKYPEPGLIEPKEMASEVLPWLDMVKAWTDSMEAFALQQALSGIDYPGYKIVEGRSNRRITDDSVVIAMLSKEGYQESEFMKPATLRGIGDLEKLVGKKHLAELCADYIEKPRGKPTLTTADDKRPAYNTAADDFNGIDI